MSQIERKKKKCGVCGFDMVIFARGLCQQCYRKAVSQKTMLQLNRMAKKKIRPRKLPTKRMNTIQAMTGGIVSQPTLFKKLWDDNQKEDGRWYCYFTGEDITMYHPPHPQWMSCCMHILSKGKFSYWKFHLENMRLGHPEFHTLVDFGTVNQRRKSRFPPYSFEMFYSLQEQLKLDYQSFRMKFCLP
jgi:hypothetical protein